MPALWLSLHGIGNRIRRATGRLAEAIGRAPRMAQWVTNQPFVQDSLKSSEFTDLLVEEDEGIDAETARIARAGLVRLYYRREFDRQAMAEELGALSARAPSQAAGEGGLLDPAAASDLADAARLCQNFDGFMRVAAVDPDPTSLSPEGQQTLAQAYGAPTLQALQERLTTTTTQAASHITRWIERPPCNT